MNAKSMKFTGMGIFCAMLLAGVVFLEISSLSAVHMYVGKYEKLIPNLMYFASSVMTGGGYYFLLAKLCDGIFGKEPAGESDVSVVKIPMRKALCMFLVLFVPIFMFFFAANRHLIIGGYWFCVTLTVSGACVFTSYLLSLYYEDRFPLRHMRMKKLLICLIFAFTSVGWGSFFLSLM